MSTMNTEGKKLLKVLKRCYNYVCLTLNNGTISQSLLTAY